MRFKIAGILLVSFVIFTLGCAQVAWLPESDVKVQNLRTEVFRQVTKLSEKDNYFPSSFVMSYVRPAMNSLNSNNGQALIIAHDGLRNAKFTFILDSDGNIHKQTVQQYSNDLNELFEKCDIGQKYWRQIIDKFNAGGGETQVEYGYITNGQSYSLLPHKTEYGYITLSYDFKKERFSIKRENNRSSPPVSSWRMGTIRTR